MAERPPDGSTAEEVTELNTSINVTISIVWLSSRNADAAPLAAAAPTPRSVNEENAVLFLWVTSPMLAECWPVITAWDFQYKASIIWNKEAHNYGRYVSVLSGIGVG